MLLQDTDGTLTGTGPNVSKDSERLETLGGCLRCPKTQQQVRCVFFLGGSIQIHPS